MQRSPGKHPACSRVSLASWTPKPSSGQAFGAQDRPRAWNPGPGDGAVAAARRGQVRWSRSEGAAATPHRRPLTCPARGRRRQDAAWRASWTMETLLLRAAHARKGLKEEGTWWVWRGGERSSRERADSLGPSWPWDLAPCVGDITGGSAGGENWPYLALPGRPRGERGWETREELLPCRAPWPLASPMEEGERWTPLGTCAARAVDHLMHWTREAGKDQAKTTTLRPTRLLQPALPVVERGR